MVEDGHADVVVEVGTVTLLEAESEAVLIHGALIALRILERLLGGGGQAVEEP